MGCGLIFLFKQKTAYEMRISDLSSDVCLSDLREPGLHQLRRGLVVVGTGGHRTSPVGGCHRHDDRAPPNVTWYGTARAKNFPEAVLRRDIKISLCLIRRDAIAMCRASGGRVGACRPNPNTIERSRRHCVATAPVIEREDYVITEISQIGKTS